LVFTMLNICCRLSFNTKSLPTISKHSAYLLSTLHITSLIVLDHEILRKDASDFSHGEELRLSRNLLRKSQSPLFSAYAGNYFLDNVKIACMCNTLA